MPSIISSGSNFCFLGVISWISGKDCIWSYWSLKIYISLINWFWFSPILKFWLMIWPFSSILLIFTSKFYMCLIGEVLKLLLGTFEASPSLNPGLVGLFDEVILVSRFGVFIITVPLLFEKEPVSLTELLLIIYCSYAALSLLESILPVFYSSVLVYLNLFCTSSSIEYLAELWISWISAMFGFTLWVIRGETVSVANRSSLARNWSEGWLICESSFCWLSSAAAAVASGYCEDLSDCKLRPLCWKSSLLIHCCILDFCLTTSFGCGLISWPVAISSKSSFGTFWSVFGFGLISSFSTSGNIF